MKEKQTTSDRDESRDIEGIMAIEIKGNQRS